MGYKTFIMYSSVPSGGVDNTFKAGLLGDLIKLPQTNNTEIIIAYYIL